MTEAGWTREKPSKEGVYWFRWGKDRDAIIVLVLIEYGDWRVMEMGHQHSGALAGYVTGEFLGPITPDSYQQGWVAGLREAVAKLDEKREETEKEWQEDTTVPKGEHDEADCDGACDLYAVVISTLINLATQLEQLYDAQAAQDEKEVGDADTNVIN